MGFPAQYIPAADYGDRVRWTVQSHAHFPMAIGEGTFYLHWMGVSEVWNVRRDDGSIVYVYPELGGAMERV